MIGLSNNKIMPASLDVLLTGKYEIWIGEHTNGHNDCSRPYVVEGC